MLRALALEDMEPIRRWRNDALPTLRTPYPLTKEQQEAWYRDEICNRNSRSRFYAIESDFFVHNPIESTKFTELVGYGGIENIQWENRIGEISLLIDPDHRGKGTGYSAACAIIDTAFDSLNLYTVYAECYTNNPAVGFWDKVFTQYGGNRVILSNRKFCDGKFYDSVYFSASNAAWSD
jgi:RimJ/RimL family protein N-acetyltransferase